MPTPVYYGQLPGVQLVTSALPDAMSAEFDQLSDQLYALLDQHNTLPTGLIMLLLQQVIKTFEIDAMIASNLIPVPPIELTTPVAPTAPTPVAAPAPSPIVRCGDPTLWMPYKQASVTESGGGDGWFYAGTVDGVMAEARSQMAIPLTGGHVTLQLGTLTAPSTNESPMMGYLGLDSRAMDINGGTAPTVEYSLNYGDPGIVNNGFIRFTLVNDDADSTIVISASTDLINWNIFTKIPFMQSAPVYVYVGLTPLLGTCALTIAGAVQGS